MFGPLNRLARNKPLGFTAGGILGWFAWSRPFMALASLGVLSAYTQQKRTAYAMAQARKIALATGTVTPACQADPRSTECTAAVTKAAVAAGEAAMRRPGVLRLILTWLIGFGVLGNVAAAQWSNAAVAGILFLIAARPWLPSVRLRRPDETVQMPPQR